MLSGPVELLFGDRLIASVTSRVVMMMLVEVSFLVCLSVFLLVLLVECLMVFTNW